MTYKVGIYSGTVALYRDLTRLSVSDSKTECFSHHVLRNNIKNNVSRPSVMTNYDIFPSITRINTVLQHSLNCRDEVLILQYIIVVHTF